MTRPSTFPLYWAVAVAVYLIAAVIILAVSVEHLRVRADRDEVLLRQVCVALGHGESSIGPAPIGAPTRPHKTGCAP